MFDGWDITEDLETERLEAELTAAEAEISRLRARQAQLLRRLEDLQVDLRDGARLMGEWVASRLDVSNQTATRLMGIAHHHQADIEAQLAAGKVGIDRACLLIKLRELGGPEEVIADSSPYSLGHLYGLVDRLRKVDAASEAFNFDYRYLVIQPSLDDSAYKIWGQLPGVEGRIVEKALQEKESELPSLPDQRQGQRKADALAAICMDSLTGTGEQGRAVTVAEVFVDASLAAPTHGQAGVTVSSGPRVGPNTLAEILCQGRIRVLCQGRIRVIYQGEDGRPIGVSDLGEAIPPAVRSYVLLRDQGRCGIDGCPSRYRLQPHHIKPRTAGGDHNPDNLITLCWYHHHVAIHQMGMVIDSSSPPHRRRLTWHNHDPPS
jgi:hypothetical protein